MTKWSEFKEEIKTLSPSTTRWGLWDDEGNGRVLFRGQANADWGLRTTLERGGHAEMGLRDYVLLCDSARRLMGNLVSSGLSFSLEVDEKEWLRPYNFPNYEYTAYLRHHGFPSPLLDWTESPFVAAFFAFRDIQEGVDAVRIYGLRPHPKSGNSRALSASALYTMGPFAEIHERHLVQQCQYSYCLRPQDDDLVIRPFEEGWEQHRKQTSKDEPPTYKWDLDARDREEALADLFRMNITPYSLFRTADSAAETVAFKII